mgnify:CR=1 FL=1|tara:strand:- start:314 stop:508 length:195 start_codon:yes stop_codon:yes gene_type:complete
MNNKISSDKDSNKAQTPPPSFVKLAMKNMVRKGGQSLYHLALTAFGFIGFILLVAVLGKPHIPQ